MSDVVAAVIAIALLAGVVLVVTAPLRHRRRAPRSASATMLDLEAAREAKYREIRDAELDFRTGKLSAEDYRAVDASLRAEAIEILDRLERAREDAG